jgi:hypothetical protein
MEGHQTEQIKATNGHLVIVRETLRSALCVAICSMAWAGASAAAYDGNEDGNFDYRARDTPEGLPAGTSP